MASSLVIVDLFSFNDLRQQGALAAIGRAFDGDPALRPERADTSDPIRSQVEAFEAYLADIEMSSPRPGYVGFQRHTTPEYVGDVDVADEARDPSRGPRRLWFATGEIDWLEDPSHATAFGELVIRLASAFDAAYGFATHSKMPWQQRVEFIEAGRRGDLAPGEPGLFSDSHSLRDVYWLNVFGPAFVERFGNRLDSLGVRRDPTHNGGLVVWATDTPFLYDETLDSHRDYPWKQSFCNAVGPDAFVWLGQTSVGLVPSPAHHRRVARHGG